MKGSNFQLCMYVCRVQQNEFGNTHTGLCYLCMYGCIQDTSCTFSNNMFERSGKKMYTQWKLFP